MGSSGRPTKTALLRCILVALIGQVAFFVPKLHAGNGCGPKEEILNGAVPEKWPSASSVLNPLFTFCTGMMGIPLSNDQARFGDACESHDRCYGTVGRGRQYCDNAFLLSLKSKCSKAFQKPYERIMRLSCECAAKQYYLGVRSLGEEFYRRAQMKAASSQNSISTLTQDNSPQRSRPAAQSSLDFKVKSLHPNKVYIQFFSDTYPGHFWPGPQEAWEIADWERHKYKLACVFGERICYGAATDFSNSTYWGTGLNGTENCSACCYECGQSHLWQSNDVEINLRP